MASRSSIKMDRVMATPPRRRHAALSLLVLLAVLWTVGFGLFLADLKLAAQSDNLATREGNLGVVVFTGGPNRMITSMEVLTSGAGSRLLISGVNETSSRDALRGHVEDPSELFDCCVDLDYASHNTIENAAQSVAWAHENEFDGLVVVTSYYHMPRSLVELHHRDQALTIYPHCVYPANYDENHWWHPNKFRILALEYTKYEMALMRIRLTNLLGL